MRRAFEGIESTVAGGERTRQGCLAMMDTRNVSSDCAPGALTDIKKTNGIVPFRYRDLM